MGPTSTGAMNKFFAGHAPVKRQSNKFWLWKHRLAPDTEILMRFVSGVNVFRGDLRLALWRNPAP